MVMMMILLVFIICTLRTKTKKLSFSQFDSRMSLVTALVVCLVPHVSVYLGGELDNSSQKSKSKYRDHLVGY